MTFQSYVLEIMYRTSLHRTFAFFACVILALSLPNFAQASNGGNQSGGDRPESSNNSGPSDKPEKPESNSGEGGGGDDGNESQDKIDSNSPNSSPRNSNSGRAVAQDEALSAVKSGKVVSLPMLLAFMANKFPGEIVNISLKKKEGHYRYEVKYVANAAKLRVLIFDAKTLVRF